jgi:hypothetical protein
VKTTLLVLAVLLCGATAQAEEERPETLLGLTTDFDGGKITFEVASGGCTAKKDFRVKVEGGQLTLVRTRRDACKAMPSKIKIAFTLEELGLSAHKPFGVANKFIANENLAGIP